MSSCRPSTATNWVTPRSLSTARKAAWATHGTAIGGPIAWRAGPSSGSTSSWSPCSRIPLNTQSDQVSLAITRTSPASTAQARTRSFRRGSVSMGASTRRTGISTLRMCSTDPDAWCEAGVVPARSSPRRTEANVNRHREPFATLVGALALFLLDPGFASGQVIMEFPLPVGSVVTTVRLPSAYGRAMTAGPDGNLWLTYPSRPSIIRMTSAGKATEFKLPSSAAGITVGPDGNLWFAEGNKIGRLSPDGASLAQFSLQYGKDAVGIVAGPDGNLWFTETDDTCGCPGGEVPAPVAIGRVTPGGSITEYPIPHNFSAAGIIVGPNRSLWYVGGSSTGVGRATLQGTLDEVSTQPVINAPNAITLGADGNVWCVGPPANLGDSYVRTITPTGIVTTFPLTSTRAYPFDIAAGPDGNACFTKRDANKMGRITPRGVITEFDVPTPNSQPTAICVGPDGNIWFTESNAAKVGRLVLSGPAAGNVTLTVPAAASAHGVNGTFFHSDLWLMNRSFTSPVIATLTYRCTT